MSSFCKCKSYSHFFQQKISIYAIFNDQSFNDKLTNNIISFEQLGPVFYFLFVSEKIKLDNSCEYDPHEILNFICFVYINAPACHRHFSVMLHRFMRIKFTLTFTSPILLEVITWVPFMLGS